MAVSEDRLETQLHAPSRQIVAGQSFGGSPKATTRESGIGPRSPVSTPRGAIQAVLHSDSKLRSTPSSTSRSG